MEFSEEWEPLTALKTRYHLIVHMIRVSRLLSPTQHNHSAPRHSFQLIANDRPLIKRNIVSEEAAQLVNTLSCCQ